MILTKPAPPPSDNLKGLEYTGTAKGYIYKNKICQASTDFSAIDTEKSFTNSFALADSIIDAVQVKLDDDKVFMLTPISENYDQALMWVLEFNENQVNGGDIYNPDTVAMNVIPSISNSNEVLNMSACKLDVKNNNLGTQEFIVTKVGDNLIFTRIALESGRWTINAHIITPESSLDPFFCDVQPLSPTLFQADGYESSFIEAKISGNQFTVNVYRVGGLVSGAFKSEKPFSRTINVSTTLFTNDQLVKLIPTSDNGDSFIAVVAGANNNYTKLGAVFYSITFIDDGITTQAVINQIGTTDFNGLSDINIYYSGCTYSNEYITLTARNNSVNGIYIFVFKIYPDNQVYLYQTKEKYIGTINTRFNNFSNITIFNNTLVTLFTTSDTSLPINMTVAKSILKDIKTLEYDIERTKTFNKLLSTITSAKIPTSAKPFIRKNGIFFLFLDTTNTNLFKLYAVAWHFPFVIHSTLNETMGIATKEAVNNETTSIIYPQRR